MRTNAAPITVSIIITNYNYGRFLGEAIESALAQSHQHCEVIVVDDGSTDDSRATIASYAGRITAILRENRGQAAAMNSGFAQACGSIIVFLDADDLLLPHAAAQFVTAWGGAPTAARAHSRMKVIDKHGRPTGVTKPQAHLPLPQGDLRRHVFAFPDDMPWLPTSGNAYAAEVLRAIFPIPEEQFRILADIYLSHVTPLFGPVLALEQVGACYRVHGANNYETSSLVLEQIRKTILHWRAAHKAICFYAEQLQLPGRPRSPEAICSVAGVANRLISLRLDPHRHPIVGDTRWGLLALGVRAALHRFDVAWTMRALFLLWFALMATLPRPIVDGLAERWYLPHKRRRINGILARLHHGYWRRLQHRPKAE
jgi:glycosyltransferase involved in cell wall biosynthesis